MATEPEPTGIPQRSSFFSLLWGIIRHPRNTLEKISEQGGRSWLIMAILAMVLVVLPILVTAPITARTAQEAIQAQLQVQAERGQAVSPDMQQQVSQIATNPLFTIVLPAISGLIFLWIGWLVWTGALHLVSTISGGSNRFGQMWQVVVWSWLPFTLRGLLQAIFILASGEVITNPGLSGLVGNNSSVTQLIATPPSAGELALRSFLGRIDLFLVWNLALLVIGVVAAARLSWKKAVLITLGVWLVFTLLGLAISVIPSLFATGGF
jgi:hypothetical protein